MPEMDGPKLYRAVKNAGASQPRGRCSSRDTRTWVRMGPTRTIPCGGEFQESCAPWASAWRACASDMQNVPVLFKPFTLTELFSAVQQAVQEVPS